MLLSNSDIQKIENIGYEKKYFTRSKKGWLILKNKDGRCVFHNGKICLIYENRPEGCILYPLIFNKENNFALADEECPYQDSFKFNKKNINQLYMLVEKIINERKIRKK
ncbi:hypothetical protein AYK21_05380 [Thermoplasmatales archaeon SG8-52-2]|nr:MAG: hypothetical protein AYK21_05380 [Thermoplasmatales archaeon SG8-52-2]